MPVCEGCGARTDDEHIRRRKERLALAARFRPLQIKVLFLDGAPPARLDDYFYHAAKDRLVRSQASRMYFDELAKCMGSVPGSEIHEVLTLAEFQRHGFFLTYAIECPFEEIEDPQNILRRFAPTVLKRVQAIYNPTYVVPLSQATQELIRLFGLIGWGDRLVLDKGRPFVDPYLGDPKRQAAFDTGFGERIKKMLAVLS